MCWNVSPKIINQVIHVLHNLNTSPQDLLSLTKTASRLIKYHLLLDETFVLFVLRKSAMGSTYVKKVYLSW